MWNNEYKTRAPLTRDTCQGSQQNYKMQKIKVQIYRVTEGYGTVGGGFVEAHLAADDNGSHDE